MEDSHKIKLGKRVSNIILLINFSLMISKALIGILGKSTAIIADAFNNGTDVFATIIVFGGLRVAYRPPDEKHHYGHAKAESIVSKIVALIIMFTGITIGWSSFKQLLAGKTEIPGYLTIVISIFSIVIKYFMFKYTNRIGKQIESSSIISDSYNHRSDVLASFAVLIGVVGARFGFSMLDPIAGLLVSIIIFKTGLSIYLEAIDALMDTAPSLEVIASIKDEVLKTHGVMQVNEIKARKYGFKFLIDLKICVDKDITVEKGHEIASNTKQNIIEDIKNVKDVMVHVNPCPKSNNDKPDCTNCDFLYK